MKKYNKLFAILFAVLGVTTLKAQTDVTDQYLVNADFGGTYSRFLDVNTDRGVEKPVGWSVEWYQDNSDKNGMTYVAESMKQDGITWSGKSGKSYFARMRWGNATLYLRQTLQNLRPGDYELSFSVAGHTTNAANTVQVSVAGQTQSITLGNNANGDWTDYSIDFSITETTPYATVEFKAVRKGDLLKIGVDEFKLMYDGRSYYESIISKAQDLYDNNKDWAENGLADFETAISDNKDKQTIDEINEAIVALENAMATFKSLNSVDVTVKINNPNFDSNIDGWTKTGGDGNGFQRQTSTQPNFAGGFLEKWRNAWNGGYNQKDFDVYQEISNLPSGEYTVNAYIQAQMQGGKETLGDSYKDKKHGGPYYIDNDKGVWMYATSGDNSSNVWANTHNPNFGETGGGVLRTASVKVTNGVLKIGFKGIGSPNGGTQLGTYANWIACDTWTLSYFGFDPTTLLSQLKSLKDEANSLLNNEEYKTVVGAERTDLKNKIESTPEETKTELEAAITQLESSIEAFKAATSDYATLATEKEIAAGLGMSEESIASAAATTKTGLVALQDLKVAEYNYIQSTYTENATLGSWTEDFGGDLDGEGYKASGPKYLDDWQGNKTTRTAKQTVTLPAGDYALSVIARGQAGASGNLYYKIGDVTTDVALIMKDNRGRGVDVNGVANFSEEGEYNCNGEGFGWEYRFITFRLDTETQVEIGASVTIQGQWASVYAPVLLTTESSVKVLRMTEITNLLDIVPTGEMNATVQSTLDEKKDAAVAASVEDNTIDELTTIATELKLAIEDAKASIASYSNIKKYIDHAKDFDETAVSGYETKFNQGQFTTEEEETVRQELNVLTANYVAENFKNEIKLTDWGAESNAMWSTQGEHWDGTATTTYYDANGTNTTHTLAKTVELTPGTYVFRAAGRSNTNTTLSLSINIDGIEPAVFHAKGNTGYGIATDGTATFNESASYARDGQGQGWEWQFIKFTLTEESTVTLTATCQTNGWGWASFGNNGLWMDDATYVIANAGALTTPLASAKELVEKPMGNNEKDALTSAITQAEGEITTPKQLDAAVEALNKAINEAKPSIETYATIKTYIDKADKIDASIAAGYKSQYDNGSITETATNVFQALEVATYNYVTENFNYAVPISSTWNSTGTNTSAKEFNNEHWSGETRGYMNQNDDNGQGWNASAWSLDFDQDVTLPAGEYVFKVAGRKSVDATLELVVTMGETTLGTVADFPNGSTGRGINKAGAASFDPEDPKGFTRDDRTGFGWQWRYVKFTLDAEATVKIAVHAETDAEHNWVSFGDYTLQMTEETYLEANKGGLDAPTAAAEALVDTKPMGATANTALKNALELPVTTGAELLAKIEALETAVANANAWVAAYNEAKAPLVAAFERFESDYNDGANGCLLPITDEAWQELLEAVKSAALAKDAYNDYSGFKQAAKNFNEAMDNATYKGFSMSNQLECTNIILNADCQANDAWAGNGRSVLTGQHWSGDASRVYFAQNHENGAARNQTVTMPYKGWYILKVSVRAVVANSYVDIQIDGASNKLQGAHGREGGTIATDGTEWENIAAGIAAGKKFANDNKGYGWIYKYIAFNVENANTEVKIGIALSNKDQNGKEANVGGMELYYVGSNAYIMAGNVVKHYGEYTETIATTHTTHDVTNATMSDPDVNVTANPNALIIANEGQVSNENNVVVNGTASSLVLTEGYTFNATTNFTATALNYARKFSANWLTVCLPFVYEIPENVKVETLSAVDLDTKTFTFEEVNETMEANKPYIIKNSSETAALFAELGDVAVEATPEAMTVEVTAEGSEHKAEFIGTYTAVKTNALMEITEDVAKYDILFFGNDGQLYYLSNGVTTKVVNIKPFRAYIRLPKGAINWSDGQQAIARHGKRTTSIDNAELATDNAPVIYDLMGRKVIQMQKGHMYIVNGKKVVIK